MWFARAAMIRDSGSHRIFKIDELTRLIAGQLVLISRGSAVNLACACRYLEEPVLSTLWEKQWSLHTLLEMLPEETWGWEHPTAIHGARVLGVVGDPPPEAWSKVRRYASWMRQTRVDEWSALGEDTFRKLRVNSPAGGWFPALQELTWTITESSLPYADLFFSPQLKKVFIYMSWLWCSHDTPCDILPSIASTISALPASTLQLLVMGVDDRMVPWGYFKDSLSSVVLRCGPSLTEFTSPVPLSDVAINHLIHLPYLRTWRVEGPSPTYSTPSPPLSFPPITEFTLGEGAAHGWLSLFRHLEDSVSTPRGVTPLSRMKESLNSLNARNLSGSMIDVSFTSSIQIFRGLAVLNIEVYCHDEDDEGQCIFRLTNDDVSELAMELPHLNSLTLGHPCFENICATTVACLLSISVHCTKLWRLEIHFNTTNIVDDLKSVSEDPQFQKLHTLPKCALSHWIVHRTPLTLDEPGLGTVVNGMIDVFPSLEYCQGLDDVWDDISSRIADLRGI